MRKAKIETSAEPPAGATGAPAVLRRLEADALDATQRIDDAKARRDALMALGENAVDKIALARVENDLAWAKDDFVTTAKVLLSYDKGVKSERREGEKVPVNEAREWIAQLVLSLRLATEQALLSSAQAAALCDEAEAFAGQVGPLVRAAFDSALATARRDGVLPDWAGGNA